MNNFEKLKLMSVEELAEWLNTLHYDNTPWLQWFDSKYCSQCDSVVVTSNEYKDKFGCSGYGDTVECAYCEWENGCKFFPKMDEAPSLTDILKMWFVEEVEDEKN